jgi:hypothetical protein
MLLGPVSYRYRYGACLVQKNNSGAMDYVNPKLFLVV